MSPFNVRDEPGVTEPKTKICERGGSLTPSLGCRMVSKTEELATGGTVETLTTGSAKAFPAVSARRPAARQRLLNHMRMFVVLVFHGVEFRALRFIPLAAH